jgi:hypothetical protein
MRWLLHGNLAPAVGEALKRHEHDVVPVEFGPDVTPAEVLETARVRQLEILTADAALAEASFASGARFGRTIVFLNVDAGEVEQDDAVDRLFARYKRLSPGRLYTVTRSRVKIRQLPG